MLPIALVLETLCFFVAVFLINDRRAGIWQLFIPYLACITIGEWAGWCMMKRNFSNLWLYNIISLLEASFMLIFFRHIFSQNRTGKYLVILGYFFFLIVFSIELLVMGTTSYAAYSQIVSYIWIIVMSLAFYYTLLRVEDYVILSTDPEFWFVTGDFLFALGSIASNLFFSYFYTIQNKALYPTILNGLCFILYSCWTYAFVCKYQKKILS